jgi:hypothetical protein
MPRSQARRSGDVLKLAHCTVEFPPYGVRVTFKDGTHVDGVPHHDSSHYAVISHRCGYADDLLSYAREPDPIKAAHEECLVQTCQRHWRAGELPIIGGVDWTELKAKALELLG